MNSGGTETSVPLLLRRSFLFGLATAGLRSQTATGKGQTFPSEARRYADGATEFMVTRLTNPENTSLLTAPANRSMSGRNVLVYSSDRSGRMEVYRLDIKSGQTRQLTDAEALDPRSVALAQGERFLYFFDGSVLKQSTVSSLRERDVYRVAEGVERGRGFCVVPDGSAGYLVEQSGGRSKLVRVNLATGQARSIVETAETLEDPAPCGGTQLILFKQGGNWHLGGNGAPVRLAVAAGEAVSPLWSTATGSVVYLNISPERAQLNSIREFTLQTKGDKLVSKTSQFVSFSPNPDASVFVGASGSKASPNVLLLVRSVRRELTICEHRARDPRMVNPMFAPNSQRVLFGSDLHGKPAIYTMNVERFVEETEL